MLYESLDSKLEIAIASICDSDWKTAQDSLTQRLDESNLLGRRRLNLYLLSVVAARAGHAEVSARLAEVARATPEELAEPRYLGSSDDPVRRQLEQDWWAFNHWNPESSPSSGAAPGDEEVDWAALLDGALEGRAGELERRWSRHLDGDHPQRHVLWNLVALGYLESGDPRTYEEMREQQPAPSSQVVPEALAALLREACLHQALTDLEQGRWLTSDILTPPPSSDDSVADEDGGEAWEADLEASFSLLAVGRPVEAARKLGPLSLQKALSGAQRTYTLNALALALFASGEYSGAQEALADCRAESASLTLEHDELAQRYAEWLASAGARPVAGGVLCDPFDDASSAADAADETSNDPSENFWNGFEETLEAMRRGEISGAKRTLRRLASEDTGQERTRDFLLSLLFAGTALLEGDHMEAQESIDDASRLLESGAMEAALLVEAQGRLAAAGAMTLASKMEPESLATLDPWRDFPADFAS